MNVARRLCRKLPSTVQLPAIASTMTEIHAKYMTILLISVIGGAFSAPQQL